MDTQGVTVACAAQKGGGGHGNVPFEGTTRRRALTGHGYVEYKGGSHGIVCLVIRLCWARIRAKRGRITPAVVSEKTGHGHVHKAVAWSQS